MFRHLSVKSFYSFGCGVASIESLCAQVRELGFRELALTDINGLYGIGWFLKSCLENGLTPIIGAEARHPSGRAVLLAYSRQGYSHLCHILSSRHLDQTFALAGAVLRWRDGLIVISDSFPFLEHVAKAGGRQDLYVELRPGRNRSEAMAFSRKSNIPPLVTNDVHFLDPGDYDLHVKVAAIHHKSTLRTVPREELADAEAWLKSAKQMAQEFASHPEALANVETVARQCAGFKLEFDHAIFPKVASPDGKTSGDVLRELTVAAARKKYAGSVEVMQRLERELEIIIRKGFADTFLVMRDIVQRSAYRCGRGSAAASLVSHLLDITDVDPISCDLYFGRFLNESRTDPPDIDMDFCRDERRAIIDSVFEQYGDGKVAMVANHNCMGMRQAIRRLAELEGLPQAEIALLTRFFSGWGGSIEAFTKTHPMFKGVKPSDKWPKIFKDAERLVGLPSHLSLHPGGIVVAADGIDHYIPRQRSRNGIIAIQTEKDQTEDVLKFVKFDILGNTSLCVIRDTLNAIRSREGQEIDYRDWRRFAADAKVRR
jgi:error-prone DNA polymerase